MIQWIFFDVGSTLVDETAAYDHRVWDMISGTNVTFKEFDDARIAFAKQGLDGNSAAIKHFGLTKTPWHSEDEVPYSDVHSTLAALRDEGTSYHYAPPSRFMAISERARKAIEETVFEHGMKYQEVITWSTDGFFRETKEKVAHRKSEGCSVVEMECSALAAVSAFRGATWGTILYTADSLADVDKYDERNWGGNAYEYALTLCLDAVLKL